MTINKPLLAAIFLLTGPILTAQTNAPRELEAAVKSLDIHTRLDAYWAAKLMIDPDLAAVRDAGYRREIFIYCGEAAPGSRLYFQGNGIVTETAEFDPDFGLDSDGGGTAGGTRRPPNSRGYFSVIGDMMFIFFEMRISAYGDKRGPYFWNCPMEEIKSGTTNGAWVDFDPPL